MKKVSFIIPVYNVEQYLRQCVESIIGQTYRDIEIILVDDGSQDECPGICDIFANSDCRVRVIHKENGGLSDARNAGLQQATGDYVVFVDGDDFWIDNDQLDALVKIAIAQPDCDFIGYNCLYYYPDSSRFTPWVEYAIDLSKPIGRDMALIQLVKSGTFPMSACLKLMKREFLINNNLFFVKGQIAEDIPWFINVLDKCDKCSFVNQYVYAYRQNREGSISNTRNERSFRSLLNIVETETNKVESRSFSKEAKRTLYSFLAYELCILYIYPGIDRDAYSKLKSYSWLLQYDQNPKVRRVKILKRVCGLYITIVLLKLYDILRMQKK